MEKVELLSKEELQNFKNAQESIKVILEQEPILNKIGQHIYILNDAEKKKVDEFLKSIE